MNTRWNATRRFEEEVANAGAPPHCDKVPPLEENANVDQALVNPPPMKEAQMRVIFGKMAQAMTTQSQAVTVQAQAMNAKPIGMVLPVLINKSLLWLLV